MPGGWKEFRRWSLRVGRKWGKPEQVNSQNPQESFGVGGTRYLWKGECETKENRGSVRQKKKKALLRTGIMNFHFKWKSVLDGDFSVPYSISALKTPATRQTYSISSSSHLWLDNSSLRKLSSLKGAKTLHLKKITLHWPAQSTLPYPSLPFVSLLLNGQTSFILNQGETSMKGRPKWTKENSEKNRGNEVARKLVLKNPIVYLCRQLVPRRKKPLKSNIQKKKGPLETENTIVEMKNRKENKVMRRLRTETAYIHKAYCYVYKMFTIYLCHQYNITVIGNSFTEQ